MNVTTAEPLVLTKIERNNTIIDLLDLSNDYLDNYIILFHRYRIVNNKRKDLIQKINELENKQRIFYSVNIESDIASLTNQVNDISADVLIYEKNICDLKDKISITNKKISDLNRQIPNTCVVTNFAFKISNNSCRSL